MDKTAMRDRIATLEDRKKIAQKKTDFKGAQEI